MICDKCNFKTKCHEILVAHVARKHKQCLKCAQTFSSNDDLLTHLQFVHGENVKCNKCEFKAYPSFELVYHQMIDHGICGRCNDEPNEKDHHMKVQHQSRIQEMTVIQNERRKPGPKSRQITTMNSEGESEPDDEEEAFETSDIETVVDSDDNEDVPIQAVKRAKQNTVPQIKPGPKSRQIAINMTTGPLSMKKLQPKENRLSLPLPKAVVKPLTELQNKPDEGGARRGNRKRSLPGHLRESEIDDTEENDVGNVEDNDFRPPPKKLGRPPRSAGRPPKTPAKTPKTPAKNLKTPGKTLQPSTVPPKAVPEKTLPKVSPRVPPPSAPSKAPPSKTPKTPAKAPPKTPAKVAQPSILPSKTPAKTPAKVPTKTPAKVPSKTPAKVPSKTPAKAPTKTPAKPVTKAPPPKVTPTNTEKKEDLSCKYCNTYFTYTAPNKKALVSHLKTLHQAELAKESPAYRKEIFGYTDSAPNPTPAVNPTPTSAKQPQKSSQNQVDTPRPTPVQIKAEKFEAAQNPTPNPPNPILKSKIHNIPSNNEMTSNQIAVRIKQELNTSVMDETPETNTNANQAPMQQVTDNFSGEQVGQNNAGSKKTPDTTPQAEQPDLDESLEEADPGEITGDIDDSNKSDPKNAESEEVDLNCKLCNKWFTYTAPDKESLKDHYATIHKGEKIPGEEPPKEKALDFENLISKVYKCVHCPKGKMFTHQSSHSLKLHMKVNHRNIFMQDKLMKKEELPTTLLCSMCKKFHATKKDEVIEHIKNQHRS